MPLDLFAPFIVTDIDTGSSIELASRALYTTVDKNSWIYQPNIIRRRHRNRGPRESFKINQEIVQSRYDILMLRKKLGLASSSLENVVNIIDNGGAVDEITFTDRDDNEQDMILLGFENLSAQIDQLRHRVAQLEA